MLFFLTALTFSRVRRHHHKLQPLVKPVDAQNGLPSSGIGYFQYAVKVRAGPSTSSASVDTYHAGDTVSYDRVVQGDGRTWISYIGGSGNRRYCCAIDIDGTQLITTDSSPFGGRTGMKNIPPQGEFAQAGIRGWGCCFLASCVKGGCTTQAQCVQVWNWATSTGRVRLADAWVSCGCENLARDVSSHMGLPYHSDYRIVWNCHQTHFYVFQGGHELFNSAGLGWGVC